MRLGASLKSHHSIQYPRCALPSLQPDVIIFDSDADHGARELFRSLVDVSQLPVIVVGSAHDRDDLIWYLDRGAAAYVLKPVSANVIAARAKSFVRRQENSRVERVLNCGDISIDVGRHEVRRDGQITSLTPTEFRLLEVLVENADMACNQRMLLKRVWGPDFVNCAQYLRLYIGYLRSKLEDDPRNPRLLITEWGMGYRLVSDPAGRQRRVRGRRAAAAQA